MALAILGMIYNTVREPARWRWLTGDGAPRAGAAGAELPEVAAMAETLVPGPNDLDPMAVEELQAELKSVLDRRPLQPHEMPAYWRLMAWSRTQPLQELSARAARDVAITRLWEQPENYRGKLIELRLHVRRVLQYAATENAFGITTVCEAWGWTDESRSAPYVVVMPEVPPGLPVGTDVRAELLFVGYFFKTMAYQAVESARSAPLLIGRAKVLSATTTARPAPLVSPTTLGLLLGASALVLGGMIWFQWRTSVRKRRARIEQPFSLPGSAEVEGREEGDSEPSFRLFDDGPRQDSDSER
jgi:hypothetical protein